jgi:hypothetical protein
LTCNLNLDSLFDAPRQRCSMVVQLSTSRYECGC